MQVLAVKCIVSGTTTGKEPPKGNTKGTEKGGRRRKQLLDRLKEKNFKQNAPDGTFW